VLFFLLFVCKFVLPPGDNPTAVNIYIISYHIIMWKNIVEPGMPQMTIWRMRFACLIPKATNAHPEYVFLSACQLRQRLHERPLMLRCLATECRTFTYIQNVKIFIQYYYIV